MQTLDQIVEIIQESKRPYLYLQIQKTAFHATNAGAYECENCTDDQPLEEKSRLAAQWLQDYVKRFPAGTVFLITMKTAIRANGNGITGPLEFKTEGNEEKQSELNVTPTREYLQSLGYIPAAEMQAAILQKEIQYQREMQRRDFEDLKAEFESRLEDQRQTAINWSPESLNKLAANIAGLFGVITGKQGTLQGTPTEPAETERPKPDPKALAVNSFAELMYKNMSLKEIEQVKKVITSQMKKDK